MLLRRGARFGAVALLATSLALVDSANAQTAAPQADGAPTTVPSLAATLAAMPKNLPRAKGPDLTVAIAAAVAAQQACAAKGAPVSVLVADSVGAPVVLISGDGAGVRSALIARSKVNIVAKFKMASGDVKEKAKTHPELAAEAAADPDIGLLREGGFPVMQDGKMIGAVAVSGGSLSGPHSLDEDCARVAVGRLEKR
ncbi:MAG: GlcG/HbpS family heme-binding protein [Caulobacteraceae bacterium]